MFNVLWILFIFQATGTIKKMVKSSVCALAEVLYLGLLVWYSHAFLNCHANTEGFFMKPKNLNYVNFVILCAVLQF